MKSALFVLFVLSALCRQVTATMIVHDPGLTAKTAADEVVNFAKWAKTELDAAQTQLNTLNQYEQTLLYVTRFGNPAALRNLPGVSTVAELVSMYGQVTRDYQQLQGLVNPSRYRNDLNSILSAYSQPSWSGFTSMSGANVAPLQGLYQFPVSDYNIGQTVQQQLASLEEKKRALTKQRDSTLQSLQSATTASDVAKYHAVLDGLNGAIADVSQSEAQLAQRAHIQQRQNAAAQQIYQASLAERRAAAAYQGIDRDLSALPISDFHQPTRWAGQ
jgi:hypothetical protein